MPDKVPGGSIADYLIGLFSFLDIVFADDFDAGSNGFQDFLRLSRLGGGYQFDAIG
jgi:hypothetical protein